MNKIYTIMGQSESAVLLKRKDNRGYKVYDIEGDVICMTSDYSEALNHFQNYDINLVRNEKESAFKKVLKEIAES